MPDKKNAKPQATSSTPVTPQAPQTQWANHDHLIASTPAPQPGEWTHPSWHIPQPEKRLAVTESYKNRHGEVYDLELDLIIGKEIDVLERELTPQEIEENLHLAFRKMYAQIDEAIAQGKAKKRERKPPISLVPLSMHPEPNEGATPFKWDFWNTQVHPLEEPDVYTDAGKYRDLFKGLPGMQEEQTTAQQNTRNATTSPIQKDMPIQIAHTQDRLKPDYTQEMYQYVLDNTPPDPGVARAYIEPNAAEKAKRWLSEQSIISPFAWMTGHTSPPPSAAQDLAKPLAYFIPNGIGLAKAVTEACLGIASGKPTTGDYVTLGLSVLPYAKGLSSLNISGEIVYEEGTGYKSFAAFKKANGPAGPQQAWHHIVEQTPGNIEKFGPEAIHNTNNLIKLPHGKGTVHQRISDHYSSKASFTKGMTVRKWLSPQSFNKQYNFGIKTLKRFQNDK